MDLSVVIVNTNTRDMLRDCLKSIFQETKGIEYEVIVSDNNSTDGSKEMMEREFPEVIIIKSSGNMGFSGANNLGFGISKGRYILALNPDTIVLKTALSDMVGFMDNHTEAGACGCKLLNADKTLQPSWENFPTIFSEIFYATPFNKIFTHSRRMNRGDFYEVDWVMGACLMVRREVLEKTGGFDEIYNPIYSEETDWCYRIKKLGWKIYYYPEPEIIHLWGQTTKKKAVWFSLQLQRNKYLFFKKNYGIIYANVYRGCRLIIYSLLIIYYSVASIFDNDKLNSLKQKWKLFILFLHPKLKMPN
ncbi:MAG: glycosyltransferase family 2 protein [bacterium]|nr:glycosyltransferase family 2 protein [bacterium]